MSDCEHGFEDWTDRTVWRVLNNTGCPSCLAEQYVELRTLAQAVVDSGSMCMDMQVVSIRKFNALAALLEGEQ